MNQLEMQALLAVGVLPEQLQKAAVWVELFQIEERVERRIARCIDRALSEENPFSGLNSSSNSKPPRAKKIPYQGIDLDDIVLTPR